MKEMDKKQQVIQCVKCNNVTEGINNTRDGYMGRSREGYSFTLLVRESLGKKGILGERAKEEEE